MNFEQADAVNQAIRLLSLRHRARAAALLAEFDLHTGQEVLLLELDRRGPLIQAELSDALGCEPPSVTVMTRKLERAGYVCRSASPTDRRATVVELTTSGKAVVADVKKVWCELAAETVDGLSAATVAELPDLLGALARNVDSRQRRGSDVGTN